MACLPTYLTCGCASCLPFQKDQLPKISSSPDRYKMGQVLLDRQLRKMVSPHGLTQLRLYTLEPCLRRARNVCGVKTRVVCASHAPSYPSTSSVLLSTLILCVTTAQSSQSISCSAPSWRPDFPKYGLICTHVQPSQGTFTRGRERDRERERERETEREWLLRTRGGGKMRAQKKRERPKGERETLRVSE